MLLLGCESPPASHPKGPEPILGRRAPTPKPKYIDVSRVPERDDIVAVYHFWHQMPWLRDSLGRVVGFKTRVYFQSAQTQKGAFVPGRIFVWLRSIEPDPQGGYRRRDLHFWELDRDAAYGFRVTRESVAGYSYGFALRWPDDLRLEGREIEVEFAYERRDGRLIRGRPHRMRVPGPADIRPIRHEPATRPAEPS